MLIYQRKHAQARKIIKQAKKRYWQLFFTTIGSETQLREVWSVLKKMVGVYRNQNIPVLIDEGEKAATEEEKDELLAFNFQKAHSTDNLEENYKRRREEILKKHQDIYVKTPNSLTALDATFKTWELKRVLMKVRNTAPGKDRVFYNMIKHMDEIIPKAILVLFNKIWIEGQLPLSWKQAVIIPIPKPGKDYSMAGNYLPIALTSNLCKVM